MKIYHLPYSFISHPAVIGKLLYVAFCNRIFNFSLVLYFLWNGVGVDRVLCSSGYRLRSVVKYIVSSVLGNSSL